MKAAMQAAGILRSATVRPPTHEPSKEELAEIRAAVEAAGLTPTRGSLSQPSAVACWRVAAVASWRQLTVTESL